MIDTFFRFRFKLFYFHRCSRKTVACSVQQQLSHIRSWMADVLGSDAHLTGNNRSKLLAPGCDGRQEGGGGWGKVAHAMWCEPRPDIVNAMSITCEQWGHANPFNRSWRNCFEAGNCINLMYEQGPEIQVHYNSTSVDDEIEMFRWALSSFRELKFGKILHRLCYLSWVTSILLNFTYKFLPRLKLHSSLLTLASLNLRTLKGIFL